jgi:hypothetical protein
MSRKIFILFVTILNLRQTHIDNKRPVAPNQSKIALGRGSWANRIAAAPGNAGVLSASMPLARGGEQPKIRVMNPLAKGLDAPGVSQLEHRGWKGKIQY